MEIIFYQYSSSKLSQILTIVNQKIKSFIRLFQALKPTAPIRHVALQFLVASTVSSTLAAAAAAAVATVAVAATVPVLILIV